MSGRAAVIDAEVGELELSPSGQHEAMTVSCYGLSAEQLGQILQGAELIIEGEHRVSNPLITEMTGLYASLIARVGIDNSQIYPASESNGRAPWTSGYRYAFREPFPLMDDESTLNSIPTSGEIVTLNAQLRDRESGYISAYAYELTSFAWAGDSVESLTAVGSSGYKVLYSPDPAAGAYIGDLIDVAENWRNMAIWSIIEL